VWTRALALPTVLVLSAGGAALASPAVSARPAGSVAVTTPAFGLVSGDAVWGSKKWGDKTFDDVAKDGNGVNRADHDPGSLFTITTKIHAREVWGQKDATGHAITGRGVTVALLDSGVSKVKGLDLPGKVVEGPDLSLEVNSPDLQGLDTFGHGTHLAGIVAGHDNVPTDPNTGQPKPSSANQELGVAPDARLLALKLATTDGSTDVSQVIAALDWVVEHRSDNGMNVRVVNLSFGTTALQRYQVDPLAAAAENAWRHGLVVVVSGGNQGQNAGALTDPAIDPYVIAVGSSDPATDFNWDHPRASSFSSVGTDTRHVDLVAPGRSIAALRDPGSFVDAQNPHGRVDGDTTGRLFRGSGTSQAAAVVSGAAALLLQADPSLTPDEVKHALVSTTDDMPGFPVAAVGAGELNVKHAFDLVHHGFVTPAQSFPVATGQGSLEAARGGAHLIDADTGDVLSGEVDVQGNPWDPAAWYAASAAGQAWSGGRWLGARWSGDDWSGARWSSSAWDGARWSGARWSDASWDGARWSGARWSSAGWSSAGWNGVLWSDDGWS
jgi:serine protease AprX